MTSVSEYIKKRKAELKQQYPEATTIDIGLVNYKITAYYKQSAICRSWK